MKTLKLLPLQEDDRNQFILDNQEVIDAIERAKILSRDPFAKRYQSFNDALEDLDD